jgi:hypothetical protein
MENTFNLKKFLTEGKLLKEETNINEPKRFKLNADTKTANDVYIQTGGKTFQVSTKKGLFTVYPSGLKGNNDTAILGYTEGGTELYIHIPEIDFIQM